MNYFSLCSIVCSGQAAVIIPRQVTFGLGSRRVKAISAAKHHTVIATEGGELFTWGSNRGNLSGCMTVQSLILCTPFDEKKYAKEVCT